MDLRTLIGLPPSKLAQENRALSQEVTTIRTGAMEYVREGMMVALGMALEDRQGGWLRMDGFARDRDGVHLSFSAIQAASKNARALIQANPIMEKAVATKMGYVWGEGCRISGADTFVERRRNKTSLFSENAQQELQRSKSADGNVMILIEGVNADIIPFYEINGAIYNPERPSEIWYFLREWQEVITDFTTGAERTIPRKKLYPNMDFDIGDTVHPDVIRGVPVHREGVIKHVRANALNGAAWGLPDILSGIFYATEHKELIEASDSIFRAQSQYAVQYKTKSQKALNNVAAMIAGPPPIDPRTGDVNEYGQQVAFGDDIEMQLMGKIGGGIDFNHFDPIIALAVAGTGVPLNVITGEEEASDAKLPFSALQRMKMEQRFWGEVFRDVLLYMGATKKNLKIFWPKINPDPTHRQVQSIVGAAKTKTISPQQTFELFRDTFGADWEDVVPDPSLWDDFEVSTLAPGAVEGNNGPVTPGQGQTGQVGKLADGDHSLRDEGGQAHTEA